MSDETIAVGFVEDNGGTNKLIQAVNKLADAADKLSAVENKTTAATDRQGAAARKASSDNDLLSRSMGGASSAASGFAGILGTLTAGFGLSKILGYAETYTNLQNKLRLVTVDQKAANAAIEESFQISQRTYTPLNTTAELYGKMGEVLKATGKDTKLTGQYTEAFASALALSGATTEQAASATLQFGQAVSQSKVEWEDFGTLIDSAPALMNALAQGMKNGVGITRQELIQLAKQGNLTRDQLLDALGNVAPRLRDAMSQVTPSISQAFNNLQNSLIMYIGKSNEANSFTGRLSQGILLLANNINIVFPAVLTLIGVLGVLAAVQVGSMLFGLASSMLMLATNAALAAVAIGTTFLVPLVALGAALGIFFGILQATGTTFAQFVAMLPGGQAVLDAWNKVVEFGKNKINELNKSLNDVKNGMKGAGDGAKDLSKSTDAVADSMKAWEDQKKDNKQALDNMMSAMSKAVQESKQLESSMTQTGAAFQTSAERVAYFSNILMNDYSTAAANAAQKAATLADNISGSGSAAAMAAGQYDQAASSADNYASSASRASSAASSLGSGGTMSERNFGSQNPYSSGSGGTTGGFFIGRLTETMKIGGTETSVTKNSYEGYGEYFKTMKDVEKNANAYLKLNPGASATEAAVAAMATLGTNRPMAQELLAAITSQNPISANAKGFAHGGDFKVGGSGGTDSQLVQFWASPNEHVSVTTPAQRSAEEQDNEPRGRIGRGGVTIKNLNVVTKDSDSFRKTRRQSMYDTTRELTRAIS